MADERREDLFAAVGAQVDAVSPGRFRLNPGHAHYRYFHDLQVARLNLYVALQQRPGPVLFVGIETEPSRPDTYVALAERRDAIDASTSQYGPLDWEEPIEGGRKKGVVGWRIPRPHFRTDDEVAAVAQWAAMRIIALHGVVEPFWPVGRGPGGAGGGERARSAFAAVSLPNHVRRGRRRHVEAVQRITDGEATAVGEADHEDAVDRLHALVVRHGLAPREKGDPDVDIAWRRGDGVWVVVEVKATTPANESHQIRLGLGQVIEYATRIEASGARVVPAVAASGSVDLEWWRPVGARAGVVIVDQTCEEDLMASDAGWARRL